MQLEKPEADGWTKGHDSKLIIWHYLTLASADGSERDIQRRDSELMLWRRWAAHDDSRLQ